MANRYIKRCAPDNEGVQGSVLNELGETFREPLLNLVSNKFEFPMWGAGDRNEEGKYNPCKNLQWVK